MITYDFSGFRSGTAGKLVLLKCYSPTREFSVLRFHPYYLSYLQGLNFEVYSSLDIQTMKYADLMLFTDTQNPVQQRLER